MEIGNWKQAIQPEPVPRVLITETAIRRRVRQLARDIKRSCSRRTPVVLGLMNGALFFLADLLRELPPVFEVRCAAIASYKGTKSTGKITGLENIAGDFKGRDVLIVDDILDTGRTLAAVRARLLRLGAKRVDVCVLLVKKKTRRRAVRVRWAGFEIDDEFVVGYGLDYDGLHRGLKDIRIL